MKLRFILLLCTAAAIVLLIIYVAPLLKSSKQNSEQKAHIVQQSNQNGKQQSNPRSEWTLNTDYGAELWIALTEVNYPDFGVGLTIYAFIEERDFTEENLRRIFTRMAKTNHKYVVLDIHIYTDEKRLAWAIYDSRFNGLREVPTPEQLAEAQKPKNYFYAVYSRTLWPNGVRDEWFAYTPNKTQEDLIKTNLKP